MIHIFLPGKIGDTVSNRHCQTPVDILISVIKKENLDEKKKKKLLRGGDLN